LHLEDVRLLLELLQRLVDEGNSVLVTEHHIELLAAVDWLIDLGPEAGAAGGQIVAAGTPQEVAANPESRTGSYLRAHFAEDL
jgi:excinuclease ABC subunit A